MHHDAFDDRFLPSPPVHTKALRDQSAGRCPAHLTEPKNGDLDFGGGTLPQHLPYARVLLRRVVKEAPLQAQRGPQRRLGHRMAHSRIHHAGQRQMFGDRRVVEQLLDTSPQRLHEVQPGEPGESAARRVGHQCDVHGGRIEVIARADEPLLR